MVTGEKSVRTVTVIPTSITGTTIMNHLAHMEHKQVLLSWRALILIMVTREKSVCIVTVIPITGTIIPLAHTETVKSHNGWTKK